MALPESGIITLDDVRKELKRNDSISLNDTDVRELANKVNGEIKMSDFYGKSSEIFKSTFIGENLSINLNQPDIQVPDPVLILISGLFNIPKMTPFHGTVVKNFTSYELLAIQSMRIPSNYGDDFEMTLVFNNNIGNIFNNKVINISLQNSNEILFYFKITYLNLYNGYTVYDMHSDDYDEKSEGLYNFLYGKDGIPLDIFIK